MLFVKNRLRNRNDILLVLKKGERLKGKLFGLAAFKKGTAMPRFTVFVNRNEVKKATQRNRIKRRVRAAIIKTIKNFGQHDIILFPKKETIKAPFHSLTEDLKRNAENLQNHRKCN